MLHLRRRRLGRLALWCAVAVVALVGVAGSGCSAIPRYSRPLDVVRIDLENSSLVNINNAYFFRRSMLHHRIDAP